MPFLKWPPAKNFIGNTLRAANQNKAKSLVVDFRIENILKALQVDHKQRFWNIFFQN